MLFIKNIQALLFFYCFFFSRERDGGQSAQKHKSAGLKITSKKITMLKSSNGADSPVTITDLVHADGSPAGTEVIIKIPVLY